MIKNFRDISYSFFLLLTGLAIIWAATAGFETLLAIGTDYEPIMLKIPWPDYLCASILFALALKGILVFVLLWKQWSEVKD